MVIHVDSNNFLTAKKVISISSICDLNVSVELQEKFSRGTMKGLPKYLTKEEINESIFSSVSLKSVRRIKRFNRETKKLEDSLSILVTFGGNINLTCPERQKNQQY